MLPSWDFVKRSCALLLPQVKWLLLSKITEKNRFKLSLGSWQQKHSNLWGNLEDIIKNSVTLVDEGLFLTWKQHFHICNGWKNLKMLKIKKKIYSQWTKIHINYNKSCVMQLCLSFSEIVIRLTLIASHAVNKVTSLTDCKNKAASQPLREVGHWGFHSFVQRFPNSCAFPLSPRLPAAR